MGHGENVGSRFRVIKLNDNAEAAAGTMKGRQDKIGKLLERVIGFETTLEIVSARPVSVRPGLPPIS